MRSGSAPLLLLMLTAACATPAPPPPPTPAPAAQATATRRPPPRGPTRPADPRLQPPATAAAPAAEAGAAAEASRVVYRVRSDGVVGCGQAEGLRALRMLRADSAATPRQLAEAHRDGRCMTTFSNRVWTLDQAQDGFLRLRLVANGGAGPLLLWFAQEDVGATAAEAS